jgi:hypothetical protein
VWNLIQGSRCNLTVSPDLCRMCRAIFSALARKTPAGAWGALPVIPRQAALVPLLSCVGALFKPLLARSLLHT